MKAYFTAILVRETNAPTTQKEGKILIRATANEKKVCPGRSIAIESIHETTFRRTGSERGRPQRIGQRNWRLEKILSVKRAHFALCYSFSGVHNKTRPADLQLGLRKGIPRYSLAWGVYLCGKIVTMIMAFTVKAIPARAWRLSSQLLIACSVLGTELYFYYPGQKKRPLRLCIKSEHCSYHGISKNQAWLRFGVQRCAKSRIAAPLCQSPDHADHANIAW